MSRRRAAEKREIHPDAKFGEIILTKFINNIMYYNLLVNKILRANCHICSGVLITDVSLESPLKSFILIYI